MNVNDGHLVEQAVYDDMTEDQKTNYEQVPDNLSLSAKLELMGKQETHVGKDATSGVGRWARSRRDRLELKAKKRNANKCGDYENPENGCPNCGRFRVMLGDDKKHRCEKCCWCIEDADYDLELLEYSR